MPYRPSGRYPVQPSTSSGARPSECIITLVIVIIVIIIVISVNIVKWSEPARFRKTPPKISFSVLISQSSSRQFLVCWFTPFRIQSDAGRLRPPGNILK
jgi:hypothetical protein